MSDWRIVDESEMTAELDAEIRRHLCRVFPDDVHIFSRTRAWNGSFPAFSAFMERDGEVKAHVGVVDRLITAGGEAFRIAGVMNVFVVPEERGRSLSGKGLAAAMREAAARNCDLGLLFCLRELEKHYAGHGWISLADREIIRSEAGLEVPLPEKNIAMFLPLRLPAPPEGTIHLRGNDW